MFLGLYHTLTRLSGPVLQRVLAARLRHGKEDENRLGERMGQPGRTRPEGNLVWFHAASVGEAQSTLVLVRALLERVPGLHILVTTGTVTSAALMARRLPELGAGQAFHQFYPLDHPQWVRRFLDHWRPDMVFWMESELWPNMLLAVKARGIPCVIVNARLSPQSFTKWFRVRGTAATILSVFDLCLAQSAEDAQRLKALGMQNVHAHNNLKYAAAPLPCNTVSLARLQGAIGPRPRWLFASTHAGEEEMACAIHKILKREFPGVLSIIAPRHPERGEDIATMAAAAGLSVKRHSDGKIPSAQDDIYIADTLGELGLFYRLCPVACIGRTFSRDGGGGHNPIEAAQLDCAVLHGPLIQNQAEIFAQMHGAGAATAAKTEAALCAELQRLFADPALLQEQQEQARNFAQDMAGTLQDVMADIDPLLVAAGITRDCKKCA